MPANDPQYSSLGEEHTVQFMRSVMIVDEATQVARAKMDEMLEPEVMNKRVNDLWNAMDLNKDGQVTKDEFVSMYLAHQTKVQMEETYKAMGIELPADPVESCGLQPLEVRAS